jgi:hypothetical protein
VIFIFPSSQTVWGIRSTFRIDTTDTVSSTCRPARTFQQNVLERGGVQPGRPPTQPCRARCRTELAYQPGLRFDAFTRNFTKTTRSCHGFGRRRPLCQPKKSAESTRPFPAVRRRSRRHRRWDRSTVRKSWRPTMRQ